MAAVEMSMQTLIAPAPVTGPRADRRAAVLASACEGYRAGTTGRIVGSHDGCLVFAPDRPDEVARWARPRETVHVPPSFVLTLTR